MARRLRRRVANEAPELNITTFLNLMVVLVPFLLITAVFSRITILELNMPTSAGAASTAKQKLPIEVIVRDRTLELGDGRRTIARLARRGDGEYDYNGLRELLLKVKGNFPDRTDATVLLEGDIEYDYLVKVMDVVRGAAVRREGSEDVEEIVLFPDISIGDAP